MAERTSTVVPHNMFDRHHQRSALCRGFRAACVQAAGALVLNARDDERLLYSDPSTALELSRNPLSLASLHTDDVTQVTITLLKESIDAHPEWFGDYFQHVQDLLLLGLCAMLTV